MLSEISRNHLIKEIIYKASLSSGAGGQNVNKVNTKIELRFQLEDSIVFNETQKQILTLKLENRINKDGFIVLSSQTERSQLKNKEKVTERFFSLIEKALKPVKKRRPTRPTKASRFRRLEEKSKQAEKKTGRKPAGGQGMDFD